MTAQTLGDYLKEFAPIGAKAMCIEPDAPHIVGEVTGYDAFGGNGYVEVTYPDGTKQLFHHKLIMVTV